MSFHLHNHDLRLCISVLDTAKTYYVVVESIHFFQAVNKTIPHVWLSGVCHLEMT